MDIGQNYVYESLMFSSDSCINIKDLTFGGFHVVLGDVYSVGLLLSEQLTRASELDLERVAHAMNRVLRISKRERRGGRLDRTSRQLWRWRSARGWHRSSYSAISKVSLFQFKPQRTLSQGPFVIMRITL